MTDSSYKNKLMKLIADVHAEEQALWDLLSDEERNAAGKIDRWAPKDHLTPLSGRSGWSNSYRLQPEANRPGRSRTTRRRMMKCTKPIKTVVGRISSLGRQRLAANSTQRWMLPQKRYWRTQQDLRARVVDLYGRM